jgi:cytoskeletal protein RodZ
VTAEAFGEKLRRQRERNGVSLLTIADQTKIGRRLFADLERGDCSRWPAGIYARAYVRAYAQAIGLDAADVVAEFCELFPHFAPPPTAAETEELASASARRGWLAQLRDLLHRADSRLDLLLGIERSD